MKRRGNEAGLHEAARLNDLPQACAAPAAAHRQTLTLVSLMILVALAVAAAHWPALSAQALSFDDWQYFVDNPLVQKPSLASAVTFFREVLTPSTVGGYYQPLAMISLMFDHVMGGHVANLRPFHRTSLALHALNTVLLVFLLYLLFHQPWPAAMVGLLFGVHPLTVEPIPWIGERKTLLAAFFALWAFIAYVRYARTGKRRLYVATAMMYVLALLSKPTSTPLPAMMLLMDFWPLRRLGKRAILEKLPLFAIGGLSAVVTFISQARTAAVSLPGEYDPARIPITICHNVIFYLYKFVWPANLSSHYPIAKPFDLSDPMLLAGVIGTCILVPAVLIALHWTRAPLAGGLIYVLGLLPTMQIVGFSNVIASDKYVYVPSVGILMVLCYSFARLWTNPLVPRRAVVFRTVLAALVVLAASSEALATRRYLTVWRDTEGLYRHMIRLAPKAPSLYGHLGNVLLEQGRVDEAINLQLETLKWGPEMPMLYNDLANALVKKGRAQDAVPLYLRAMELRHDFIEPYTNLATALVSLGRTDEAIKLLHKAIDLDPKLHSAYYNLGTILVAQGKTEEALTYLLKALEQKPNYADAHNNVAIILAGQGKVDEAIQHFREAVKYAPDYLEAHYNLARTLEDLGRLDEAAASYREVLRIDPNEPDAKQRLTACLARKGMKPPR